MMMVERRRSGSFCASLLVLLQSLACLVVVSEHACADESVAAGAQSPASAEVTRFNSAAADRDAEIERLLAAMTLDEKIGQMCQVWPETGKLTPAIQESLR